MTEQTFLDRLLEQQFCVFTRTGTKLGVWPSQRLTDSQRKALQRQKQSLLKLLTGCGDPASTGKNRGTALQAPVLTFRQFDKQETVSRYHPAMGTVFTGRIAFSCQTVDHPEIPRLALMAVSDGTRHFLVHPEHVGGFIRHHCRCRFITHGLAHAYWVIEQLLTRHHQQTALQHWKALAWKRQFSDVQILDQLLRLAQGVWGPEELDPRGLSPIVEEFLGQPLVEPDTLAGWFGELLGEPWDEADPGYFLHAAKTVIVIDRVHQRMRNLAREFHRQNPDRKILLPDCVKQFGYLTDRLQALAAIALAAVERIGVTTDTAAVTRLDQQLRSRLDRRALKLHRRYPGPFVTDQAGGFQLTPKAQVPQISLPVLEGLFKRAGRTLKKTQGKGFQIPRTEEGGFSTSLEKWQPWIEQDSFLREWETYQSLTKLSEFLPALAPGRIHSRYNILVRTGRTSCEQPNFQQIPARDELRQVVVPAPGHLLLVVDYRYVELVTLGAICLQRYGSSRLAEIITAGIDPHAYTAALLRGQTLKQFQRLRTPDPEEYQRLRQLAKPVNFGVPAGMGPETLRTWAVNNYGVAMTLQQAKRFHRKLISTVYPELKRFLRDTGMASLAANLQTSEQSLWTRLDWSGDRSPRTVGGLRNVLSGHRNKTDGTPYDANYVTRIWDTLNDLNQNSDLTVELSGRVGSPELAERLFHSSVTNLSGRIRGGVNFTEERNTQFQGLAADGAKLGLSRLVLSGYRVIAFLHDEVLVELPDEGGFVSRDVVEDVVRHLKEGMQEVTCGVPVECEYALSTCWSKQARLLIEGDRVLPWSPGATD